MRITTFISTGLLLLLLICAAPVYAIPALPHAFYGTLTLNGAPAPVGTQVSATGTEVMTSVPQNPLTTTAVGEYGNNGLYLLVQGDIPDGATITFYVNGVSTEQTAEWHSGETTQLDLSATISPTPTTPATPSGGGGGGGGGALTLEINFFGTNTSIKIDSKGIVQQTFTATSPDGKLTITIPKGTKALDKYGNPLTSLTAAVNENPPSPPANANIIGLAYDFGPAGATFDPPITFTWSYDPNALPAGVAEQNLVIAYYDTAAGKWVELPSVVDTANNKITASVAHFTTFAIISKAKPAAFNLSSLFVSPIEVAPGKKVNISVSVANTGGTDGSYTVVLKINDVIEAEKSITVAAGSSQTVSFDVAKEKAGSYKVAMDGMSGSFTVIAPAAPAPTPAPPAPAPTPAAPAPPAPAPPAPAPTPPLPTPSAPPTPTNWPLIGGIIGGVIVVVIIILLLARRRD